VLVCTESRPSIRTSPGLTKTATAGHISALSADRRGRPTTVCGTDRRRDEIATVHEFVDAKASGFNRLNGEARKRFNPKHQKSAHYSHVSTDQEAGGSNPLAPTFGLKRDTARLLLIRRIVICWKSAVLCVTNVRSWTSATDPIIRSTAGTEIPWRSREPRISPNFLEQT